MSTAIARVYTPEGFVIAADGRQANNMTKEVVNDSVRKIFSIQHQTRQLAYAIAGPIAFGDFAYPIEFAKATDTLKDSRAKSLWHFSKTLADILSSKLSVTKRA